MKHLSELPEWKKIAIAFSAGTLLGLAIGYVLLGNIEHSCSLQVVNETAYCVAG